MAGGKEGVDRTLQILSAQVEQTMKLLQVPTLADLGPQHVTQLSRLGRRGQEAPSRSL
jgi:L-lactate dehydrogenase (cytochrome)